MCQPGGRSRASSAVFLERSSAVTAKVTGIGFSASLNTPLPAGGLTCWVSVTPLKPVVPIALMANWDRKTLMEWLSWHGESLPNKCIGTDSRWTYSRRQNGSSHAARRRWKHMRAVFCDAAHILCFVPLWASINGRINARRWSLSRRMSQRLRCSAAARRIRQARKSQSQALSVTPHIGARVMSSECVKLPPTMCHVPGC